MLKQGLEDETAVMKKQLSEATLSRSTTEEELHGAEAALTAEGKQLAADEKYLAELQDIAGLCNKKVTRLELKSPVVPVQSFPGLELNEFLLYHGAPSDKIQRIVEQGLDPRRAGSHFGALFGSGSYFAAHSSKSDIYTKPNNAGERCILVARVCLGEPHFEKTDKPRKERWLEPPDRADGRGPLSSLVAEMAG